uniref:KIAA0319 n=1 Tax=Oryzias latipes TaxID=8090 RepID=A0A3B3H4S3_ORYLA
LSQAAPPAPSLPTHRSQQQVCILVSIVTMPAYGSDPGPVAVAGPDRRLVLPLSSVLLNGSSSTGTGGRAVSSFRWEAVRRGLIISVRGATSSGFRKVRGGLCSINMTSVVVLIRLWSVRPAASSPPPVAHASGSHTLTLPNNSLVLRGSVSDGDQSRVHFLWTRDPQSPAAGVVLFGSRTQPSLFLADLVEGTYLFQLKVTDAQGRSSVAMATVEVRPGGLTLQHRTGQQRRRDTVVQQLAALIRVPNSDVHVRALEGRSVGGLSGPVPSLKHEGGGLHVQPLPLWSVCFLSCSGRGQCDPITRQCGCDPFWTENLVRRYLGDGESNCGKTVLHLHHLHPDSGRRSQARKRAKYAVLNDMDEQERLELRPRFSVKHRSTEHNCSLMMSESELDSDQDAAFSEGWRLRSRSRAAACSREAFG